MLCLCRKSKKEKYFMCTIENLECTILVSLSEHINMENFTTIDKKTLAVMLGNYSADTQDDFAMLDMPFHST